MSKRRYRFNVTDLAALEKAFPQAIETIEIPARTEKRAMYGVISKLLDCKLDVPGIEVVAEEKA